MAGLRLSASDVLFNWISETSFQAVELGFELRHQAAELILRNTTNELEVPRRPQASSSA